jgi:hypothetical protein
VKNFPKLYAEDIYEKVKEFVSELQGYDVPVDIEAIIESLDIEIIPVASLLSEHGIEATTNGRFNKIFIDYGRYLSDKHYRRARFSLAHELGHILLHREFLDSNPYETLEEWLQILLKESDREYGILEFQANIFAGAILVPEAQLLEAVAEGKKRIEIARLFEVSEDVIKRRIHNDKKVLEAVMRIIEDRENPSS